MDLKELTTKDLIAAHNEAAEKLGKPTVKRFADRPTALKRTRAILAEFQLRRKTKDSKTPLINWPYNGPGKGQPNHRVYAGRLAAQFVEALAEGTTMDKLCRLVEAQDKLLDTKVDQPLPYRVRAILRSLHTYNGYGIKETEANRFQLVLR